MHETLEVDLNPVKVAEQTADKLPFFLKAMYQLYRANILGRDVLLVEIWKKAYESALPEYSEMNASKQENYAIGRGNYFILEETGQLQNLNDYEGNCCIEVWKYSPVALTKGVTKQNNVDPLSLYLSLKENRDERIEMALEKIIENYIW